jgi:hypothetical protein
MTRPFADTLFWVGLVSRRDQYHARAQAWGRAVREVVTTEAVLIETAGSLAKPAHRGPWLALLESVRTDPKHHVVPLTEELLDRGWEMYAARRDKAWSLTDCISFLVMADLGLTAALTADDHFRQAGFDPLLADDPPGEVA